MKRLFEFVFALQSNLINHQEVSFDLSKKYICENIEEIENCYMAGQDIEMVSNWLMVLIER